jgi:hypothetical protein
LAVTNPKLLVETQPLEWADAAEGFAMASFLRVIGMLTFAIAGLQRRCSHAFMVDIGRKVTPLQH